MTSLPHVSYIAQIVSISGETGVPGEVYDLACCALCGRVTPWKEGRSSSSERDWTVIREPHPLELFRVPVGGGEFYRRIATSIYHADLIGIWCPDCAASRTVGKGEHVGR